jgi:hypothetical protein
MDQATQQNAIQVQEAAAASEALMAQAGRLAQEVSVFKLGNGRHEDAVPRAGLHMVQAVAQSMLIPCDVSVKKVANAKG